MVGFSKCLPHAIVSKTLALTSYSASLCLIFVVSESFISQSKPWASTACVYFSSNLTFLNSDKIEDTCTLTTIEENCGPLNNLLLYQKKQEGCRWCAHEPRSQNGESIDSSSRSLLFYGTKKCQHLESALYSANP